MFAAAWEVRRRGEAGETTGFSVGEGWLCASARSDRNGGAFAAAALESSSSRAAGRAGAALGGTEGATSADRAMQIPRQAQFLPSGGFKRQQNPKEMHGAPLPRRTGAKGTARDGRGESKGGTLESDIMGRFGEQEALTFQDKEGEGGPKAGSSQGKGREADNLGDSSSAESGGDRDMRHIFDWSEEEAPGLEDDGITMKMRRPMRTYERRWGVQM
ncbi:hypothetical protein NDU88_006515 [Pleurodeles waltl]|uniref:Uncharacterized protein n=1 Tax=Pleurodeles waltl TaxID=8319 RepID=A0AAV7N0M6_PLEWA|nr:hypothetical protein NDU88_006515 [Pleurodeles waltl]